MRLLLGALELLVLPKWIYHVPYVGVAKVFEMPLLGYLGYFPFAMELWLLAHLLLPRGPQVEL